MQRDILSPGRTDRSGALLIGPPKWLLISCVYLVVDNFIIVNSQNSFLSLHTILCDLNFDTRKREAQ